MDRKLRRTQLVFLGDVGVGKSSIFYRLRHDKYDPEPLPTQNLDVFRKTFSTIHGSTELVVADTGGFGAFGACGFCTERRTDLMFPQSGTGAYRRITIGTPTLSAWCTILPAR